MVFDLLQLIFKALLGAPINGVINSGVTLSDVMLTPSPFGLRRDLLIVQQNYLHNFNYFRS